MLEREELTEPREIELVELADDQKVTWYTPDLGGVEIEVKGKFIKRAAEVLEEYGREIKLTVIGATVLAMVVAIVRKKRSKAIPEAELP
ncbi:MAG: hypothetical protein ABIB61_00855 [Candidatus Shapirobacteria bacterium]